MKKGKARILQALNNRNVNLNEMIGDVVNLNNCISIYCPIQQALSLFLFFLMFYKFLFFVLFIMITHSYLSRREKGVERQQDHFLTETEGDYLVIFHSPITHPEFFIIQSQNVPSTGTVPPYSSRGKIKRKTNSCTKQSDETLEEVSCNDFA